MWAPEGNNRQYYSNKDVDAGLVKGMKTADPEERKAVYAKVQKQLVEDAAWGMLVDMVQSVGMVPSLMGVETSPLEFVLVRNAYFKN
jgi:ABC-type transport system substrate-binding protein